MTRTLPSWRDDMSDGCTFAPDRGWWGDHRWLCVRHDERYYFGGSKELRLAVDVGFFYGLLAVGMPRPIAYLYYRVVRVWGHPRYRIPGVSWAFGGEFFAYSDEPAREE